MPTATVIGAGIAGCSTGYLLSKRGYDVTIVEKDAVGGLLRDIEFDDGTYCDSAPHLLFFEDDQSHVKDLFSRFSTLDELKPYAKSYPRGQLSDPHHYPVTHANAEKWEDEEEMVKQLDNATSEPDGDTFDEFVTEQVGPLFYERYFHNYTKKHWGVDPSRITGDWFDYKINFPEAEQPFFGDSNVYYPREKYVDILSEMISDCTLVFDEVQGLDTGGGEIQGIQTKSGRQYESDIYINTVDPSIVADTDLSLNYRSMVIVGAQLELDTGSIFPEQVYWGYFANDYDFTRLTEYSFTDQEFAANEFVTTFEFPCFTDENLWTRSSDWFATYIQEFFADQGIEATVKDIVARRAPWAYPLPVASEIEKFEQIEAELANLDNLYNLGRVSTYQYIWIKDIVEQAYETVNQIESSTHHMGDG